MKTGDKLDGTRRRHAEYFTALASKTDALRVEGLERLGAEENNLQVARGRAYS